MALPSLADLQHHARALARAFDARLIEAAELKPDEALAIPHIRVALVSPIIDHLTYAVALHELGHLAAPTGNVGRLTAEDAAWTWAKHYALEWTEAMERLATWAEGTHQQFVEEEARRRARFDPPPPPVAPPAPRRPPLRIDWEDWK